MVPQILAQVVYACAAQVTRVAIQVRLVILDLVSVELLLLVWDKQLDHIVTPLTTFASAHQL